ncbi:MAG TPA: DUF2769 domain-containing protein [Methanoregulaceae archaeon]|nr:DUF2769 domain-containing protein [Methanoregulaceae archaeon]
MSKFEENMQAMAKMSKEEQEKKIEMLKGMCQCPTCPSYNTCAKNSKEILFCSTGKSFMCISEEKGCVCPTCPVAPQIGLKYTFFCTRGAEKSQRYENTLWGSTMVR